MRKKLLKSFLSTIDYKLIENDNESFIIENKYDNKKKFIINDNFFNNGGELDSLTYKNSNDLNSIVLQKLTNEKVRTLRSSKSIYSTHFNGNIVNRNDFLSVTKSYSDGNIVPDELTSTFIAYYDGLDFKELSISISDANNSFCIRIIEQRIDNKNIGIMIVLKDKEYIKKEIPIELVNNYIKGLLYRFEPIIIEFSEINRSLTSEMKNKYTFQNEFHKLIKNSKPNEEIDKILENKLEKNHMKLKRITR